MKGSRVSAGLCGCRSRSFEAIPFLTDHRSALICSEQRTHLRVMKITAELTGDLSLVLSQLRAFYIQKGLRQKIISHSFRDTFLLLMHATEACT